jgi:hypothetical protein
MITKEGGPTTAATSTTDLPTTASYTMDELVSEALGYGQAGSRGTGGFRTTTNAAILARTTVASVTIAITTHFAIVVVSRIANRRPWVRPPWARWRWTRRRWTCRSRLDTNIFAVGLAGLVAVLGRAE